MRERLVQLGAEPTTLPAGMPAETIENVIGWRLRELRESGRL